MNWLIIYNRDTLQIEYFVSSSCKMPTLEDFGIPLKSEWSYVQVKDMDREITRDSKLIFDGAVVVGTEPSPNPIELDITPPPPPRDLAAEIDELKSKVVILENKSCADLEK